MNITLEGLKLVNFRRITTEVRFHDKNYIYGPNEAGKTTLFDAVNWLFFDKNSLGQAKFSIKTLDADSNAIPMLDHSVEGSLLIDGQRLTLKKVFTEQWTKKRNSAKAEFTGHTTDYFIDGVPVKANEYKAKISEIVKEDLFKLITDVMYFNVGLDWKQRREILLKVVGDISDTDVIASSKELADLVSILNGRQVEDHKKIIAARRKELNEQLAKISVRVDEANRSKPSVDGFDPVSIAAQVTSLQNDISDQEAELVRIQSGGEIAVIEKRLREIEGEQLQIKNDVQGDSLTKVQEQRTMVSVAELNVAKTTSEIKQLERQITDIEMELNIVKDRKEGLLASYWTINAEEGSHSPSSESCPVCGQAIPEEQLQAAHDKARAEFNRLKAERLERNIAEGKRVAAQITELQSQSEQYSQILVNKQEALKQALSEVELAKQALRNLQDAVQDFSSDPSYVAKKLEWGKVNNQLEGARQSSKSQVERAQIQLHILRNSLTLAQTQQAQIAQAAQIDKRIADLMAEEKTLAAEFERLERELYLCEQFTVTKVNLLESRINSKFKLARFKMFEKQVNGAIAETCETLYNGVPYSTDLNHGHQIIVGLDIVTTLQEHYGIKAPIWIDNAEAVTQELYVDSQLFALYASASTPALSIEEKYRDPIVIPQKEEQGVLL